MFRLLQRPARKTYQSPSPGLHTYRIPLDGGQMRLHLRVEQDGTGVLFRDVSEVVHLNSTAAELAWLALEQIPLKRAAQAIKGRYSGASRSQVTAEAGHIYALVDGMRSPGDFCPTCALADDLRPQRADLFSTPVHAPYKADLALTYGCNNACSHCYNEPSHLPMASLPKEQWFQVIKILHEAGVPHLILTGGEATLHPDLLEIIRYADSLGHIVGMNSNGRRLAHRPFVDALAAAGLNHVQITLASSRPELHDAINGARCFHQTVRGIENALASPLHTITNTTLMRRTMDHAEEIVEFLHALGIRTFAMNGLIYSGGGFGNPDAIPEAQMPALLLRVRDRAEALGMHFLWYTPTEYCRMSPVELELGAKRCNAGEYSLCIEPNGDVLPCQSFYVAAGNILHDPWQQIWQGELFRSFRDRVEDPRWAGLPSKCWECPDLPLCGGGCRIEREARDGVQTGASCSGCATGRNDNADKVQAIPLLDGGWTPPLNLLAPGRGNGSAKEHSL
jgi:radical SAM protein with 4Fe4S-binding SPASM domain